MSSTGLQTADAQDRTTPHPFRGAPLALAFVLLPFAVRMRRAGRKLSRLLPILLLCVAAAAATFGLSGCGSSGTPAQSPQSYTLTVTATSGSISRTTNLTLTVE
jgi:apolipoprotein N-acyltransferase